MSSYMWICLQIMNVTFEDNRVYHGGILDLSGPTANVVIECSRFHFNTGGSYTADIYLRSIRDLRIANSIFLTNYELDMPSIRYTDGLCDIQLWNTSFKLGKFPPIISNDKHFLRKARSQNIIKLLTNFELIKIGESYYASVYPVTCSSSCYCYYNSSERANILNCSGSDVEQFNNLHIPDGTTWIIAAHNDISHLCPAFSLENITHFDVQFSNITSICDGFFLSLLHGSRQNITHLNLAGNKLKSFSKGFKKLTFLETLYLSGNPIECTCDNVWLRDWVVNFTTPIGNKIIQDYNNITCADERWNNTPVYKINYIKMGCYPRSIGWTLVLIAVVVVIVDLFKHRRKMLREIEYLIFCYTGLLLVDHHKENLDEMEQDAFLFFCEEDQNWVWKIFDNQPTENKESYSFAVEREHGFRLLEQERDFHKGTFYKEDYQARGINKSRRMIVIFSNAFLNSPGHLKTFRSAIQELLHRPYSIISIVKEELSKRPDDVKVHLETNMIIDATKLDALQKRQDELTAVDDKDLDALRRKLDSVNKTRRFYQRQLDTNKNEMSKIDERIQPEKAERLQNIIDNFNRKLENLNDKQNEHEIKLTALEEKKERKFDASELEMIKQQVDYESTIFQKRFRFLMPHTPLIYVPKREVSDQLIVWPYSY